MELPSAAGAASLLWHAALVGMFVVNRLDYAALRHDTSSPRRSLLGGADDAIAQLRSDMEQVINVRFGELQSTSAAEVAELRDELAQVNEKVESATSKLQRDIDELRGPKKRRRRRRAQDCAITVGGGGGVLGLCAVFDTESSDHVTLPGGAAHTGSDCPEGAALAHGDAIAWTSSGSSQGSVGHDDNGCAAKGTCGLPWSGYGLGGGWELCFA
eukprot:COSAG04_NODE_688_length_11148_cov_2.882071_3_plen_214_part_00